MELRLRFGAGPDDAHADDAPSRPAVRARRTGEGETLRLAEPIPRNRRPAQARRWSDSVRRTCGRAGKAPRRRPRARRRLPLLLAHWWPLLPSLGYAALQLHRDAGGELSRGTRPDVRRRLRAAAARRRPTAAPAAASSPVTAKVKRSAASLLTTSDAAAEAAAGEVAWYDQPALPAEARRAGGAGHPDHPR